MNHVARFTDGNGRTFEVSLAIDLDDLARKMATKARLNGRITASTHGGAAKIAIVEIKGA